MIAAPVPAVLDDADLAQLLFIRYVERALLDLFAAGQISGTVHTCLGQEYVPVALAPLIAGDMVLSNHRGHGHYLAHLVAGSDGAGPDDAAAGLLAEILGRDGALCHGVGGSQHLLAEGRFLSTGVQGESLPVAVGIALHLKRSNDPRLAVAFVGDGTWGEGAVYEALNMAALWSVPLLVVVEHNDIAQTTPTRLQLAGTIAGRAAAFGVEHHAARAHDVAAIRAEVGPLIAAARRTSAPLILEFHTIRLGPHSKGDDTRPAEELARLRERDWATGYAATHPVQFAAADAEQRQRVARLVADVQARPRSTWSAGGQGVD